jgi:Neutral/alkaline non-lysosomal ceramidase, N-terminal
MKKSILFLVFSGLLVFSLKSLNVSSDPQQVPKGWKAGVSRAIITPSEPIWLAGYASRTHPSEGVLTELWVKVLAIEDAKGKKAILIASDLLGFPKKMSDRIRNKIAIRYGLTRSQIILSYTHTHSGPVLMGALFDIYPLDENQLKVIQDYSDNLENKIVDLTGKAIEAMVPAKIFSQSGVTRFQVNRRNNVEAALTPQTSLKGPNDYAVPVLKVTDSSGSLMAVAFGYACHATVLDIYQISGDYPGFAQIEIEKAHPGVTAMFFQGAGADENPLPRRTVPLARQYGKELAAAVERVLSENMKTLEPVLWTAYSEVNLTFSSPPSKDSLIKMANEGEGYQKRWAVNQLRILKNNGSLMSSYPYPIEVWKLGDQIIMALGGELVVGYSIGLKKLFGQDIFVLGYVNDDMAYIPSESILEEGGYEGESSQMVYGLPAKWHSGIEMRIYDEMKKLAAKIGVMQISE